LPSSCLAGAAESICANGGLAWNFREQERVAASLPRAAGARSCGWQLLFVLPVKRRIREVKMDFPRNPSAKLPHSDGLGALVFEDG